MFGGIVLVRVSIRKMVSIVSIRKMENPIAMQLIVLKCRVLYTPDSVCRVYLYTVNDDVYGAVIITGLSCRLA